MDLTAPINSPSLLCHLSTDVLGHIITWLPSESLLNLFSLNSLLLSSKLHSPGCVRSYVVPLIPKELGMGQYIHLLRVLEHVEHIEFTYPPRTFKAEEDTPMDLNFLTCISSKRITSLTIYTAFRSLETVARVGAIGDLFPQLKKLDLRLGPLGVIADSIRPLVSKFPPSLEWLRLECYMLSVPLTSLPPTLTYLKTRTISEMPVMNAAWITRLHHQCPNLVSLETYDQSNACVTIQQVDVATSTAPGDCLPQLETLFFQARTFDYPIVIPKNVKSVGITGVIGGLGSSPIPSSFFDLMPTGLTSIKLPSGKIQHVGGSWWNNFPTTLTLLNCHSVDDVQVSRLPSSLRELYIGVSDLGRMGTIVTEEAKEQFRKSSLPPFLTRLELGLTGLLLPEDIPRLPKTLTHLYFAIDEHWTDKNIISLAKHLPLVRIHLQGSILITSSPDEHITHYDPLESTLERIDRELGPKRIICDSWLFESSVLELPPSLTSATFRGQQHNEYIPRPVMTIMSPVVVDYVKKLPHLRKLVLGDIRGKHIELAALEHLVELEYLDLTGMRVNSSPGGFKCLPRGLLEARGLNVYRNVTYTWPGLTPLPAVFGVSGGSGFGAGGFSSGLSGFGTGPLPAGPSPALAPLSAATPMIPNAFTAPTAPAPSNGHGVPSQSIFGASSSTAPTFGGFGPAAPFGTAAPPAMFGTAATAPTSSGGSGFGPPPTFGTSPVVTPLPNSSASFAPSGGFGPPGAITFGRSGLGSQGGFGAHSSGFPPFGSTAAAASSSSSDLALQDGLELKDLPRGLLVLDILNPSFEPLAALDLPASLLSLKLATSKWSDTDVHRLQKHLGSDCSVKLRNPISTDGHLLPRMDGHVSPKKLSLAMEAYFKPYKITQWQLDTSSRLQLPEGISSYDVSDEEQGIDWNINSTEHLPLQWPSTLTKLNLMNLDTGKMRVSIDTDLHLPAALTDLLLRIRDVQPNTPFLSLPEGLMRLTITCDNYDELLTDQMVAALPRSLQYFFSHDLTFLPSCIAHLPPRMTSLRFVGGAEWRDVDFVHLLERIPTMQSIECNDACTTAYFVPEGLTDLTGSHLLSTGWRTHPIVTVGQVWSYTAAPMILPNSILSAKITALCLESLACIASFPSNLLVLEVALDYDFSDDEIRLLPPTLTSLRLCFRELNNMTEHTAGLLPRNLRTLALQEFRRRFASADHPFHSVKHLPAHLEELTLLARYAFSDSMFAELPASLKSITLLCPDAYADALRQAKPDLEVTHYVMAIGPAFDLGFRSTRPARRS